MCCLDLRSGSKPLSNMLISALIAVIQLIIWVSILFTLIAQMASLSGGATAFSVIFVLANVGFSVLLLLGIIKSNRVFIQVFLVFSLAVIVLFVISVIYSIFTQPAGLGLSGFLGLTFLTLLDVLTFFIVRNYYLELSNRPSQNQNHIPKGSGAKLIS